jgi:hypothetical protein
LNDVANSIVEAEEVSDSQEPELLKKIIDNHVLAATEIVRLLKYINNKTEIKERRIWSQVLHRERNPVEDLIENIDDGIDLDKEGD